MMDKAALGMGWGGLCKCVFQLLESVRLLSRKGDGPIGFAGRPGVQRPRTWVGAPWDESSIKVNHPQEAAQLALGCRRQEPGHRSDFLRKETAAFRDDHMPKALYRRLTEIAYVGVHH